MGSAATAPRADVELKIDGVLTRGQEGQTVAALLMSLGIQAWRLTSSDEPRGAFCGIGVCYDCVVVIDDRPGIKACLTPVRDGMRIVTQRK
jgi:predicted molibdopterin-dependent oxidoreductase YjgC